MISAVGAPQKFYTRHLTEHSFRMIAYDLHVNRFVSSLMDDLLQILDEHSFRDSVKIYTRWYSRNGGVMIALVPQESQRPNA